MSTSSVSAKPRPYALCPRCQAPLISTFDFPGAEFYCLECGRRCGFLEPWPGESTPELEARHDALRAEWDENVAGKLLLHGGWLHDCEKCQPHEEPHREHATEAEWSAHVAAMSWLEIRSGTRA